MSFDLFTLPPLPADPWRVIVDDCRDAMASMPDASVDAVVTDPPYELGFMGKGWDSSGIAHNARVWREVLRVLKPGGHVLAFGGTRTWHRVACAIEDVGVDLRDSIAWLHATGFPKSVSLVEGKGSALKPAHEPIIVGRRKLDGTLEQNHTRWGTGMLNIDACRIPFTDDADRANSVDKNQHSAHKNGNRTASPVYGSITAERGNWNPEGRWPANVILDETAAAWLDQQAPGSSRFYFVAKARRGERDAGLDDLPLVSGAEATDSEEGQARLNSPRTGAGRGGGVRNVHPTVKCLALMRHLVVLVTPPGGLVLDPFAGSGSTGCAAVLEGRRFVGIERETPYAVIAHQRIAHWATPRGAAAPASKAAAS